MDTRQAELPNGTDRRRNPEYGADAEVRPLQRVTTSRRVPFLWILLFYAVLVGVASALIYFIPLVRHAWVNTTALLGSDVLPKITNKNALALAVQDRGMLERTASVLLITIGALGLSLPVAWVYTFTRRLRYDPSLVHSVIILPMVVAGIVVIVKDSVALAFSLAGIVAVVRFRNTLKDPKDAVYIFLALGIGLAAGVQALDIALVLSFMFNMVVLILWKYNFGAIYGEAARDILSVGDNRVMIARNASQRDAIRWRMSHEAEDIDADGILLVHARDTDAAKQRVEVTLSKVAKEWHFVEGFRGRNGVGTFAVLLELSDKKGDPLSLLADIDERWSQDISAAEYLPFRKATGKKKKEVEA